MASLLLRDHQRALVSRHLWLSRRMARVVHETIGRDVERRELVAVGNLALVEAAGRYDPSQPWAFATFAWKRVWGAMVDAVRRLGKSRRQRQKLVLLMDPDDVEALSIDEIDRRAEDAARAERMREVAERLPAAIERLPDRERQLVELYDLQGVKLIAAGAQLGLADSNAKKLHVQAIRRLRAMLEPAFEPAPAPAWPRPTGAGVRVLARVLLGAVAPAVRPAWIDELVERLPAAIAELPERERALVERHDLEGVTLVAAGGELGLSVSLAKKLHRRALHRLRTKFGAPSPLSETGGREPMPHVRPGAAAVGEVAHG